MSKEALEVAHKVKTRFGDEYHSKKILISILIAQGNKQQALEYHQQLLKENPKSADKNMGVLRTCNSWEKFENQTFSTFILCDKFKIAYTLILKCATRTLLATISHLEKSMEEESQRITTLQDQPQPYQSHKSYIVNIEDVAADYFKFVVVREPIKRFLSAVSNIIFFQRAAFENHPSLTSCKYLSITKLGVNPEINWLVENLESYLEISQVWEGHIKPQHTFMGNQIKGFDRVFQVERLGELGEKLSEITSIEINLPRLNTGGRKISLAELSEKSMKKLIDFYSRDYELLKDYYSPDKIWDEYQALKNSKQYLGLAD
ncbi:sulfotransferase family 2 domain-containing protein [Okeania sp. SIO2B3]|uniref:sulfotransferase family 2 domain-containing protein n=1 Tax=Okeania sp. SIO2B3 TaxID=2607784 RepID=UPI0013C04B66|nr:sulfotransferase family 2 domain-containing protein [Okeania sp. SIO2B3]NET42684.1 sulfotransferase family 2 domain-containing protein [Okeania sp. SIO2B3]